MLALRAVAGIAGTLLVLATMRAAVRTFVLPRSARDRLARIVFVATWAVFAARVRGARTYEARDRVMALYAPVTLLAMVFFWLLLMCAGFGGVLWAFGGVSVWEAFVLGASSLLTLGFERPPTPATELVSFVAAAVGLTTVALLVAYLPAMYGAFARREAAVTMLEMRAGSPPSGAELLVRMHRLGALDTLNAYWSTWEQWFVELEESHTSLAPLIFFRSPQPQRSWVTAAGTVLDAVALSGSALDRAPSLEARLCLRAGTFALQHIAEFFDLRVQPSAGELSVSVRRAEFEQVLARFAREKLPVRSDVDGAWFDFCAARAQYDDVLLALAGLTMAPYAPWSSDRSQRPQGDTTGGHRVAGASDNWTLSYSVPSMAAPPPPPRAGAGAAREGDAAAGAAGAAGERDDG